MPSYSQNNMLVSWVKGLEGAKAYPVMRGTTVLLMDTEQNNFYLKTVETNGIVQPLEMYEFKKVEIAESDPVEYATKSDVAEIKKMLEELLK